jgi:uncharacterized protein (DUF58 family)
MIIFTDRIEKFIPPKKGRSHILRIIRDIIAFKPESSGTSLKVALEYFNHVIKKRSIAFLISDFMDEDFERPMKIVARKHDLIGVQLMDQRERELPDVGLVKLRDAEAGVERWVDTSLPSVRAKYRSVWVERSEERSRRFLLSNVDSIAIDVEEGYIQPLVEFFRMRERRY